ncbi:NADP(H)-dependent aldo-keto reductase [Alkalilimnicola ehrlichii]|uniref:NADP(H)-dependent aldo-keto reductase n=1 Tax=Alkalilimnicola ehrlichii TaxID=351052 RepID=UPI003BA13858
MEYRKLGHTDIEVSALCLGTMTFGEQNTEAEAHEQLDQALARGINFIDTAEMYPVPAKSETAGRTERYIGTWLKRRRRREDVVLATKIAGPGLETVREGKTRYTHAHLVEAVEGSLQRLQTDYIDLYQLHWPERNTNYFGKLGYQPDPREPDPIPQLRATLEALYDLVEAGKIRHIGLSNETAWGVMRCLWLAEQQDLPRVVSVQNPYNLLNRSYEVGLAEVSHREGVGLMAYSPLAFGVLSGKYLDDRRPEGARLSLFEQFQRYTGQRGVQATADYVALAHRFGLDPAQMALTWVTSRPFVTSTIIGATDLNQLETNIDSMDLTLDDELLEAIDAVHAGNPNPCP